jgi:hypothetical protein
MIREGNGEGMSVTREALIKCLLIGRALVEESKYFCRETSIPGLVNAGKAR